MKIVLIGGHLSPALAVIESLPKDTEILFIGRKYTFEGDKAISLECETVKSLNIPFIDFVTGRLQRKFTRHTIPSLLKLPYGFMQSFFILLNFKPDVVLGFGGYLSFPVIIIAFLMRIPIVIHEQTLEAGLTNRIVSIFAKKICISWETSRKFFPKEKTVLTGNPNRHSGKRSASRISIVQRDSGQARMTDLHSMNKEFPILYITGGSSGSHFINILVEGCVKELLKEFVVIHQTGDSQEYHDFDRLQKYRESLPLELKKKYVLEKFIHFQEVGSILQKSELVISRAGVNTITELICFEKPAILIPLEFSQNNEQLKNALFFKRLGLGEVLARNKLDSLKLLQKVKEMINNIEKYRNKDKDIIQNTQNACLKIIKILNYVKKGKEV